MKIIYIIILLLYAASYFIVDYAITYEENKKNTINVLISLFFTILSLIVPVYGLYWSEKYFAKAGLNLYGDTNKIYTIIMFIAGLALCWLMTLLFRAPKENLEEHRQKGKFRPSYEDHKYYRKKFIKGIGQCLAGIVFHLLIFVSGCFFVVVIQRAVKTDEMFDKINYQMTSENVTHIDAISGQNYYHYTAKENGSLIINPIEYDPTNCDLFEDNNEEPRIIEKTFSKSLYDIDGELIKSDSYNTYTIYVPEGTYTNILN